MIKCLLLIYALIASLYFIEMAFAKAKRNVFSSALKTKAMAFCGFINLRTSKITVCCYVV